MSGLLVTHGHDIEAVQALVDQDRARPRSSSGWGPSGFFGCPRAAAHALRRDPKCNAGADHWEAIVGTAVHAQYAAAREARGEIAEVRLVDGPIEGNADHVQVIHTGEIVLVEDLKTKKARAIAQLRQALKAEGLDAIPLQHRAQIGWYCQAAGASRWRLVYVPRDAPARYALSVEGDYDPAVVEAGKAWLADVLMSVFVRQVLPEPRPVWHELKSARQQCATYCDWFDPTGENPLGCPGMPEWQEPAPEPLEPLPVGELFRDPT